MRAIALAYTHVHNPGGKKDLDLWCSALREITSPTLSQSPCLGTFLETTPNHDRWYMSHDCSVLYLDQLNGFSEV